MSRNRSGQHRKVEEARRVVRQALGDAARHDSPQGIGKYVPERPAPPEPRRDESVYVLTLGEVATRLGISRGDVERMIAAGKLTGLPTGYTVTVPISEVEKLRRR